VQFAEGPYRTRQVFAVIHPGAEHDLGVRNDAEASQPLELLDDVRRRVVRKHMTPQAQLRGMHRDVERAEPLLLEPLPVRPCQVRQSHEVTVKET